jgi:HK97 family phage major capsid protein
MDWAYSVLHVKSISDDGTEIAGIATTPTPDRMGDILDPLGVTFTNPVPLLMFHNPTKPVGSVKFDVPTPLGISFTASIPNITEPGALKDRVDEARQSIKAGLLSAVSVGYLVAPGGAEVLKSGGLLLKKTVLHELSLVTVPANAEATITLIKSLDTSRPVTPIPDPPVAALALKGLAMNKQTIAEQITAFETTRKAKSDRMTELMSKAGEANVTLDGDQTKEYDGLKKEVESVDAHLVRLRDLEVVQRASAQPVEDRSKLAPAAAAVLERKDLPMIRVQSVVPKGLGFVRMSMVLASTRGDRTAAAEQAQHRWPDQPEIALALKAAVPPGSTGDATWAGPLMPPLRQLTEDFMALLRPATIIGKIPDLRRVPFNVSVPMQTAGGSYGWVGQGFAKPVTKLSFGATTLTFSKVAGIIVITEELARFSSPDAESLVQNDMVQGISRFLDAQFIDPAKAALANVSPASITNGVTPIVSAGDAIADFYAMMSAITAAEIPLSTVTVIMSEVNAFALSLSVTITGAPYFPGLSATGGFISGVRVITSQAAGNLIIALAAPYILYADDGGVTIDVSREASVQMDSAPDSPTLATSVLVSLWQNNLVGLRAEQFANWVRAKIEAVQLVTGAVYHPTVLGSSGPVPISANQQHKKVA